MRVTALPAPEQLRIRRLGPPEHVSPLRQIGTLFLEDDYRILVASDTRELTLREDGAQIGFEPAGPRERVFFDPSGTRCGIVTCGGLCPGINDVIRSIVLTLWHQYRIRHIVGFRHGYSGLIEHNGEVPMALTPAAVHNIPETGGTMLGTVNNVEVGGLTSNFEVGGGVILLELPLLELPGVDEAALDQLGLVLSIHTEPLGQGGAAQRPGHPPAR